MKKLFTFLASAVLCAVCAFGVAGCNKSGGKGESYSVYAPDGAPALSLFGMSEADGKDLFDVNVVNAGTISAYVTGDNARADFAVLPVNAAVKLLGSGVKYKMLGTVTHGNLFLMKKQGGEDIASVEDLNKLVGKTVGVINLANVPGLTFKVIINDNGLQFNELKDGAEVAADKINLKSIEATEAIPTNTACDYFVVPEPAASTKKAATQGKLDFAGSLQTLYGGEEGYPQAVAVAKKSVIENDASAVTKFIAAVESSTELLESSSAENVVSCIRGWIQGDMAPMFTAANLSATVISNCGISFVNNTSGKQAVLDFMQKFNAVSNNAWGTPSEAFFY